MPNLLSIQIESGSLMKDLKSSGGLLLGSFIRSIRAAIYEGSESSFAEVVRRKVSPMISSGLKSAPKNFFASSAISARCSS